MRLLAEIILIAAIIAVAWDKPFHEWVGDAVPLLVKQSAGEDRASANSTRDRRALPADPANYDPASSQPTP